MIHFGVFSFFHSFFCAHFGVFFGFSTHFSVPLVQFKNLSDKFMTKIEKALWPNQKTGNQELGKNWGNTLNSLHLQNTSSKYLHYFCFYLRY